LFGGLPGPRFGSLLRRSPSKSLATNARAVISTMSKGLASMPPVYVSISLPSTAIYRRRLSARS
jgi:hypothetical protein